MGRAKKRGKAVTGCLLLCLLLAAAPPAAWTEEISPASAEQEANWLDDDDFDIPMAKEAPKTPDPLESVNRVFYHFNDKLYFWVLKPVATVYSNMLAEDVRIAIRNFFDNLMAPVRVANNLLQGKVRNTGIELARFAVNTTLGVAGFGDPAKNEFGLASREEDLGQTLGSYGLPPGVFIMWPFLGPSNIRDPVGFVGDGFLTPLAWLYESEQAAAIALKGEEIVNSTSLTLGDYEALKESALDPYTAIRDAYRQHRDSKIME